MKKTFVVTPLTDCEGQFSITLYEDGCVTITNGEPDIYYIPDKHLNELLNVFKSWGYEEDTGE